MTQNALLFIPDISGFTEFVHNTSISHSRHIISELLEILLDHNRNEYKLAEIEGDALFFYCEIDKVDFEALQKQIKEMYIAFHSHLKRYEYERICHCGACSSAYNLNLKFIVHSGSIDFIKVKDKIKPHGSAVIQAHRLLKNQIQQDEYALITEAVSSTDQHFDFNGISPEKNQENYDFGPINYNYYPLALLKEKLPYIPPIPEDIPKTKLYDRTEIIQVPILDLYEVISNFDYRLLWNKGIDRVDYEKRRVNRKGIKHQCLINKREQLVETTSKKVASNQLVYGETTKDVPLLKKLSIYYILEELEEGRTKLNIEVFADLKLLSFLIKPFIAKNLKKAIPENIKDLILLIDSEFKKET